MDDRGDTESQLVLLELCGLITQAQRSTALGHPQRDAVGADAGPGARLVWMVEQEILDDIDVLAAIAVPMPSLDEDIRRIRNTALSEALPALEARSIRVNREWLDQLLALEMIDESEHYGGLQVGPRFAMKSPGQMLAWLVHKDVLVPRRLEALHVQAGLERSSEAGMARSRILEDARTNQLALQAGADSEEGSPRGRPLVRFGTGVALFLCAAFGGYHAFQWVIAVPACDATATTSTVRSMLAGVAGRVRGAAMSGPTLRDIKEVGYVEDARQRGCTATLVIGNESIPYAYVIGPDRKEKDRIAVSSADATIVRARFGAPGVDGGFGNQALPVGRTDLESALRAVLEKDGPRRMSSITEIEKSVQDIFNHVDPDRTRVIAEIEPVGNCRAVSAGSFGCRVLIERNDPLMSNFGMPAEILDVEFTLERDAGGAAWRVSDDFNEKYARAIADSRQAMFVRKPGS